jgi:hypothetical protein
LAKEPQQMVLRMVMRKATAKLAGTNIRAPVPHHAWFPKAEGEWY